MRMRRERNGSRWDRVFDIWRAAPEQFLWRRHSDACNSALLERWLPRDAGRVLRTDLWDEALGEGLYSTLSARARAVVGIDVSKSVVAAAAARYPKLKTVGADVARTPFADRCFDTVVSISTLDHFDSRGEIVAALRELRRVLRPGGLLIVTFDNPGNPVVGVRKLLSPRLLNAVWIRIASFAKRGGLLPYHVGATLGRRALARTLTQEQFVIEEMRPIVHAPRLIAVVAGRLVEQFLGAVSGRRYLRALRAFEQLATWPTRYVTGHFVAARATRPED
jgi:SAM-dependent methyltransferase